MGLDAMVLKNFRKYPNCPPPSYFARDETGALYPANPQDSIMEEFLRRIDGEEAYDAHLLNVHGQNMIARIFREWNLADIEIFGSVFSRETPVRCHIAVDELDDFAAELGRIRHFLSMVVVDALDLKVINILLNELDQLVHFARRESQPIIFC